MNVTIEKYRGIEIWFDTDRETFQCDIDDDRSVKQSYTALKSFIDKWKKDTANFKCFTVYPNPNDFYYNNSYKIVGTTKDGRFIGIKQGNEKAEIISKYNEKSYITFNKLNEEPTKQLDLLEKERESFRLEMNEKIKEVKSKFIIETLSDYRENNK